MTRQALLVSAAALTSPAGATLWLGNKTWATADYVYYGPNGQTLEGPAVFLSGNEVCFNAGDVAGKIVVSVYSNLHAGPRLALIDKTAPSRDAVRPLAQLPLSSARYID